MATFIGFSTIDKDRKFTVTDRDLIKRDLLNSLLIRAGQMPGRPEVGTTIWDYIFDPNDTTTTAAIDEEVRRLIGLDHRVELIDLVISASANTIQVQVSISLHSDGSVEQFYLNFDKDDQVAHIT